jgi:rhodanese-related sulfurtransferase
MVMTEADGYAGDVSASEAYEILKSDAASVLVDVRTQAEWAYVGVPDLSGLGKEPVLIEWQQYPSRVVRADFAAALAGELAAQGAAIDAPILFICRSGARSRAAASALSAAGYRRCLNVADGFEGPPDEEQHRGRRLGWKADGLPWVQS